jgi:hypothetical protein
MLQATADNTNGEGLKKEVVEAIDEFDQWFQETCKNEPLSMPERAICDTFSFWLVRIRGKKEGPLATLPSP